MKLTGIKAVCSATHGIGRNWPPRYVEELFADRKTGKVWSITQASNQSWTVYDDPDVIRCGTLTRSMTCNELREIVESTIRMI